RSAPPEVPGLIQIRAFSFWWYTLIHLHRGEEVQSGHLRHCLTRNARQASIVKSFRYRGLDGVRREQ
ncbi:MAG TPA: hypothetical protein VMC85_18700, partial [Desulfomonilaceae bacterium]|nr:hypothetical protein [Desulfomonilaceae bacterium]